MLNRLHSSSYSSTVRSAHGLAELLKRTRPHHCAKVEELEMDITRAHKELHECSLLSKEVEDLCEHEGRVSVENPARDAQANSALFNLDTAYQALRDLKHADTAKA